jgi:hypothetical protein
MSHDSFPLQVPKLFVLALASVYMKYRLRLLKVSASAPTKVNNCDYNFLFIEQSYTFGEVIDLGNEYFFI